MWIAVISKAIDLQNSPLTKVVICDGQGKYESATEASVMAGYLIQAEIDSSKVYVEDALTGTV